MIFMQKYGVFIFISIKILILLILIYQMSKRRCLHRSISNLLTFDLRHCDVFQAAGVLNVGISHLAKDLFCLP